MAWWLQTVPGALWHLQISDNSALFLPGSGLGEAEVGGARKAPAPELVTGKPPQGHTFLVHLLWLQHLEASHFVGTEARRSLVCPQVFYWIMAGEQSLPSCRGLAWFLDSKLAGWHFRVAPEHSGAGENLAPVSFLFTLA